MLCCYFADGGLNAGQALFGTLSLDVMVLTVLYSIAGLGIAIVNDFKSIEGDRCAFQFRSPAETHLRFGT